MTADLSRDPAIQSPPAGASNGASMSNSALQRFIGGPPVAVFLRLLFVSLIVGALLIWLNIQPFEVFRALQRFVHRIWMMGFDAIREIGQYILAGAAIVVPVWLVMRLFNMRGAR